MDFSTFIKALNSGNVNLSNASSSHRDINAITLAVNSFSNKIFALLTDSNVNLVFSPLSLHAVLSLMYQASRGSTATELKTALNVPDKVPTAEFYEDLMQQLNNVEGVTLELANKIYVKKELVLKQTFKNAATLRFNATTENLDFLQAAECAQIVNNWIDNKTRGRIIGVATQDDFDPFTRLVMINAVYFKGPWLNKFQLNNTKLEKFHISTTNCVVCQMMHRKGDYRYKTDIFLDAQVVQMPYVNKLFSMIVILPRNKCGISDLEKRLVSFDLSSIAQNMTDLQVILSLPRFKTISSFDCKETLEKMGVLSAFNENANFADALENEQPLHISKVVQKAFIEVNEEGTEAAAASGCFKGFTGPAMPKPVPFRADHSFLYLLMYRNNIMFMGKVCNATSFQ